MLFLLWSVYRIFRGQWGAIFSAVRGADPPLLALICGMGLSWFFIEAAEYFLLYRRLGMPLSYSDCVRLSFMVIFGDVTTMGTATKPMQSWYAHRRGADVGKSLSILMITYIFQKLMIVVFALIPLVMTGDFVRSRLGSSAVYIDLGAAGGILISVVLFLLCAWPRLQKLVLAAVMHFFRGGRWASLRCRAAEQIDRLSDASRACLRDPAALATLILCNSAKLAVSCCIPVVSVAAIGGDTALATEGELFSMAAVTRLIMGVVPTSGGVGSLEVVFSLLFGSLFGSVTGGTLMILYRAATYYLPFLVSLALLSGTLSRYRAERRKSAGGS